MSYQLQYLMKRLIIIFVVPSVAVIEIGSNNIGESRPTIIHKMFETNFSFHVKDRTTGKVVISVFQEFLLVLTRF